MSTNKRQDSARVNKQAFDLRRNLDSIERKKENNGIRSADCGERTGFYHHELSETRKKPPLDLAPNNLL